MTCKYINNPCPYVDTEAKCLWVDCPDMDEEKLGIVEIHRSNAPDLILLALQEIARRSK